MAKWGMMDPINIQELVARGPKTRAEELRLELYEKVNALGIGAQGLGGLTTVLDVKVNDYPTHAASKPVALLPNCAATRHLHFVLDGSGPADVRAAGPRRLAEARPGLQVEPPREPRHAHQGRPRHLEVRRDAAALRQAPHRPRRRAQAHGGHARQGREAARGLHQPLHLLRRAGGRGARRGRGPRGPDDELAHGQVRRDDARADGPHRHGGQERARARRPSGPSRSTRRPTASPWAARPTSSRSRSGRRACWPSTTSAWRRSTSSR